MITFRPRYFIFALLLFTIEVLIALYVNDSFVRPYVGDFLVVILLYCAARTLLQASKITVAIGVLLFAYLVEVLQFINIVEIAGLQDSTVARTVMGTSFEWMDMLAYTLGILTVLFLEKLKFASLNS